MNSWNFLFRKNLATLACLIANFIAPAIATRLFVYDFGLALPQCGCKHGNLLSADIYDLSYSFTFLKSKWLTYATFLSPLFYFFTFCAISSGAFDAAVAAAANLKSLCYFKATCYILVIKFEQLRTDRTKRKKYLLCARAGHSQTRLIGNE